MTQRQEGSPPGRTELMDAVVQLLNRQGEKLSPSELLGLLGLCNLLGIVSFLSREGSGPPRLAAVTALAQDLAGKATREGNTDQQGLLNTLLGLVSAKGNQKINPASLLALVNLLSEGEEKKKAQDPPEPPPRPEEKPRIQEDPSQEEGKMD